MFFLLALWSGCAGSVPDPQDGPPKPDIAQVITQVRGAVAVADHLAQILCDVYSTGSQLCESLQSSWKMVELALSEVDNLYAVYQRTGLGLELVYTAVEHVITAIEQMNTNADEVRSVATHAFRADPVPCGPVPESPPAASSADAVTGQAAQPAPDTPPP